MIKFKELKEISVKKNKRPYYSYLVTRRIAIRIAWLLLHTSITATQATLFAMIIGVIYIFLFSLGNYYYSLLAVVFYQLWHIFDSVDGNIARFKKQSSPRGSYIDNMNNFTMSVLVFVGLTIGVFNSTGDKTLLYFGLSAIAFQGLNLVTMYTKYASFTDYRVIKRKMNYTIKQKKKTKETGKEKTKGILSDKLMQILRKIFIITKTPAMMNVICVFAIINRLDIILYLYGILFPSIFVFSLINIYYGGLERFMDYQEKEAARIISKEHYY